MKAIVFLTFLLCILSECYGDEKVYYAAVIYRHGDRTPVECYPTDPFRNQSLWPVKFGELTNLGKRQHYALGQWLRTRYSHLLSPKFDPTEIYVRSTDVDRTLMSAQANLAGMYPPIGNSIWDQDLPWQPIPVHTEPETEDKLLAMKKHCSKYNMAYEQYKHSKEYKQKLAKYQSLMDYLSAYTGMKVNNFDDIVNLYSVLYIETLYNFTLPNWTHAVYPDKLSEPAGFRSDSEYSEYNKKTKVAKRSAAADFGDSDGGEEIAPEKNFTTNTATPLLARLKVGPLLKHIMTQMVNVVTIKKSFKKKDHIKVAIFSGHDITVGNILNSLNLYDGICPSYTATVFMELLYKDNSTTPYIRISYRNSTGITDPHVLYIPNCGTMCPVDRFIKLYENLLTVNWDYECEKQFPALLTLTFFCGLGVFFLLYAAYQVHFSRMYRHHSTNLDYSTVTTRKLIGNEA